ncbi:hypothetical protein TRFO_17929 [Tritrichomonas foetus]|uniref:Importin N-terminal domain-containing protein n=1 Tax=Tritrichomonas foetus TaxID=1144522 RepID=A0A1J4KM10_9EUKA|nr:hypothetical protein TRFO_17929 [Tritrichomonas foetus]|eukprot:OHT12337.1 hypothetical protein TRFO_17929 [Tritrichomonas foetus]
MFHEFHGFAAFGFFFISHFCRMDSNSLLSCINAILGPENDPRNQALELLSQYTNDINFAALLSQYIFDPSTPTAHKFLCLTIFIKLKVVFHPNLFNSFYGLLKSEDEMIVSQVANLLSKNLTTAEEISSLLNLQPDIVYGCLLTLNYYLEQNDFRVGEIINFCAAVISGNYPPNIRGLASSAINLIFCPKSISEFNDIYEYDSDDEFNDDNDEEKGESNQYFIPLIQALFSLPLSDSNFLVIKNIFQSARHILPKQLFYDICLQHIHVLASIAPLSGEFLEFAATIIESLLVILRKKYSSINFNERNLIQSLILCLLLHDSYAESWMTSIQDFINDNIGDADFDDSFDNLFFYFRKNIALICCKFIDISVEFCLDIMKMSPKHMEAAFFILSSILPSDYPRQLDFSMPPETAPLVFGRYLILVARLNLDIDLGIIDECINSENWIYPLFIAIAALKADTYDSRLQAIVMRLFSMIPFFEIPDSFFFSLIKNLIQKDIQSFLPILEQILPMFLQAIHTFAFYPNVTREIIITISYFYNIPEISANIASLVLPIILNAFQNAATHVLGMELLTMLIENQETPAFLQEITNIFPLFCNIVTSIDINDDNFLSMSIMPIMAFYSKNGFSSQVFQWIVKLLYDQNIEGKFFHYFPTLFLALFFNIQPNEQIELVKAIYVRLNSGEHSNYFRCASVLSFATIIVINPDLFFHVFNECGIDVKIFLPRIPEIIEELNSTAFDNYIIYSALFKLSDVPVIDFEEEKPMIMVTLRSFLGFIYEVTQFYQDEVETKGLNAVMGEILADDQTLFYSGDGFYVNHPFRQMQFSQILQSILPPSIPECFQSDIQKTVAMLPPK